MTNPTRKQLVVQSLKALHKSRVKILFRLKALRRQRQEVSELTRAAARELEAIERKMAWEVNTNGKSLGDRN